MLWHIKFKPISDDQRAKFIRFMLQYLICEYSAQVACRITEGMYIFSRRDGDHEEQTPKMVTEILECDSIRFQPNKHEEMLKS